MVESCSLRLALLFSGVPVAASRSALIKQKGALTLILWCFWNEFIGGNDSMGEGWGALLHRKHRSNASCNPDCPVPAFESIREPRISHDYGHARKGHQYLHYHPHQTLHTNATLCNTPDPIPQLLYLLALLFHSSMSSSITSSHPRSISHQPSIPHSHILPNPLNIKQSINQAINQSLTPRLPSPPPTDTPPSL